MTAAAPVVISYFMVGITLLHHATMKDMRFGKIAKGGRHIEITLNYEHKE